MSIFFSLKKARLFRNYIAGCAYLDLFEADVYLLRIFKFTPDFEHFLFDYWCMFYHEYLHLFLEGRCGIKCSEKTINKLVARLLLFLNVMTDDIAESRRYFADLNIRRQSDVSFTQKVAHCMYLGY